MRRVFRRIGWPALLLAASLAGGPLFAADSEADQRRDFERAWRAAAGGDRALFSQLMPGLQNYRLYPYLQYEDLRHRRARVAPAEMAAFLEAHEDWAFTAGLRRSWLRSLGKHRRWDALLRHAPGTDDVQLRCHLAQARIQRGLTDGLLQEARSLWTVGKSQPDACDPVFDWLIKQDGITPGLAWERIGLAMEAGQPRLALYVARFLPPDRQRWAELWQQQHRERYQWLDRAKTWQDVEYARDIAAFGLRRLARRDADRAWMVWQALDGHFGWSDPERGRIVREMALWSAVEGAEETPQRMRAVPEPYRDGQILEWWVRHELLKSNWADVMATIAAMPAELQSDARWRYWDARARLERGDSDAARERLADLALESSYYGFLAADLLEAPYTICPAQPLVDAQQVAALRARPGFRRALELRRVGLRSWSRSEWTLATARLSAGDLRVAAALAIEEDWPEMAIFALGNSGDLSWYEWRFPVANEALVRPQALALKLDTSWIMGLMRSESAMAEDALSPAGARGLMQLMPGTARQLARRHALEYRGSAQLLEGPQNVLFGTLYLRELLDRFDQNPVLAAGAYNAGPGAVQRWLDDRRSTDPAVWVETLPYFETRDYIPRVLAFSTLYDWRLERPVTRISSRMPPLDSLDSTAGRGTMEKRATTEVVCRVSG
ncbi:MAG: transglycosylase SLT domain-containing protein [Xanthomonadales bacterium]|nr:transglycosylase SLT domain-containing protein [Xanthomonadales bacterium]